MDSRAIGLAFGDALRSGAAPSPLLTAAAHLRQAQACWGTIGLMNAMAIEHEVLRGLQDWLRIHPAEAMDLPSTTDAPAYWDAWAQAGRAEGQLANLLRGANADHDPEATSFLESCDALAEAVRCWERTGTLPDPLPLDVHAPIHLPTPHEQVGHVVELVQQRLIHLRVTQAAITLRTEALAGNLPASGQRSGPDGHAITWTFRSGHLTVRDDRLRWQPYADLPVAAEPLPHGVQ